MVSSWLVWCDSKMILLLHQNDEKLWALATWTFEATRRIPIHPFRVISCHKVFGFQKSLRCIFAFITQRDCWKIPNRNQTEHLSTWAQWAVSNDFKLEQVGNGFRSTVREYAVYIKNIWYILRISFFDLIIWVSQSNFVTKKPKKWTGWAKQVFFLVLDWKRKKDRRLFWGGAIPCSTVFLQ